MVRFGGVRASGVAAAMLAVLAGCTFQSTLDSMASQARQDEMIALARSLCEKPDSFLAKMLPEVREQSRAMMAQVPGQCPAGAARWSLMSYHWSFFQNLEGRADRTEIVVVARGADDWTTVQVQLVKPPKSSEAVSIWTVEKTKEKPPAVQFVEDMDRNARRLRIIALVLAALAVGVTGWLVGRRRAKRLAADAG